MHRDGHGNETGGRPEPPTGLDLARYADAGRLAAVRGEPGAPVCQPVSFYLPRTSPSAPNI